MNPVIPWQHDRPVRNCNPGDLRPRTGHPPWPGQDGVDTGVGGPFAIFVTNVDGWAALGLWCLDARYLRGLRTAKAMVAVFAPPSENDTASYADGVEKRIGAGDLDLSEPSTLEALCKAIAHWEDARAVWLEGEITSGIKLAGLRWPDYRAARLSTAPPAPVAPPKIEVAQAEDLNQAELDRLQKGQLA